MLKLLIDYGLDGIAHPADALRYVNCQLHPLSRAEIGLAYSGETLRSVEKNFQYVEKFTKLVREVL